MKKALTVLLILVTVFAVIGCSKKDDAGASAPAAADANAAPAADAPVTVTVWCWDPRFNVFAINEAAKIYNRDKPNVKINCVEQVSTEIEPKITTALSSGQTGDLPDITLNQDNSIQRFIQTYPDAYLPLNDKVDLSKFAKFKLEYGSYNGKNYGVPFDNGATATFLRSDIVEKAGLKVSDFDQITWERFIELGQQVKAKTGVSMISTNAGSSDFLMLMTQSCGRWFFDASGKPDIKDNPAVKKALETYKAMVDKGVLLQVADWNAYIASFNNGTVASTIQGAWIIGSITAAKDQEGKWAVVTTPRFADPALNSVNYSSQGGSGWMVFSSSKNPDAAMDFLNKTFAGSVEFYETILGPSGAISTWLPAAQSKIYTEPQSFFGGEAIYAKIMDYASKIPMVKYGVYNYEARDAIGRALANVLNGASIDSELATAQKDVEFIINQ